MFISDPEESYWNFGSGTNLEFYQHVNKNIRFILNLSVLYTVKISIKFLSGGVLVEPAITAGENRNPHFKRR
jgi:hypothetical protein